MQLTSLRQPAANAGQAFLFSGNARPLTVPAPGWHRPNLHQQNLHQSDQVQLSTQKNVHFAGQWATQKLREGRLGKGVTSPWNPMQVERIVKQDDTPFVGNIPNALLEKSKLSEMAFFQAMDKLASQLEKANYWTETLLKPFASTYPVGDMQLRVQKLGEGYFNKAYRISDGTSAYVFKIHKDIQRNPIKRWRLDDDDFKHSDHSSHHDAGIGLFLTHHQIYKDVARCYAANPTNPKAGWILQEHILGTIKASERDGKALHTDVKAYVEDDCDDNRIGYKSKAEGEPGVLFDLGGLWSLILRLPKPEATESH